MTGQTMIGGRYITEGETEVSIRGERGRFRVHEVRATDDGDEVHVYGGTGEHRQWRVFPAERVWIVHRISKLRP